MTLATTLPLGVKRTRERISTVLSRHAPRRPSVALVYLVARTNINHESGKRSNRLSRLYRDPLLHNLGAPSLVVACRALLAPPKQITAGLTCRNLDERMNVGVACPSSLDRSAKY